MDESENDDTIVSSEPVHETTAKRQSQNFPYDLIVEILQRVPVRSLMRFRCMCKSLETLISDPQFAKSHLRRCCSTADQSMAHQWLVSSDFDSRTIIFCPVKPLFQENPPKFVKAITMSMNQSLYIVGSCNGLLCLCDLSMCDVMLFNPSTRLKSKRSPIAFMPILATAYCGFGYDQVNCKYKVLLATMNSFGEFVTKVYTFGANSWTRIQNPPCTIYGGLGKFVSGALNWVAKTKMGYQWLILSFDLEKETYREMLLPQQHGDSGYSHNSYIPTLNILRSCLCLSVVDSNKTHWVVWLMKEYGVLESWTKLIMIPLSFNRFSSFTPSPTSFDPLCISENDVVLGKIFSDFKRIFLYDSKNRRINYSVSFPQLRRDQYIYHESLISPLY